MTADPKRPSPATALEVWEEWKRREAMVCGATGVWFRTIDDATVDTITAALRAHERCATSVGSRGDAEAAIKKGPGPSDADRTTSEDAPLPVTGMDPRARPTTGEQGNGAPVGAPRDPSEEYVVVTAEAALAAIARAERAEADLAAARDECERLRGLMLADE